MGAGGGGGPHRIHLGGGIAVARSESQKLKQESLQPLCSLLAVLRQAREDREVGMDMGRLPISLECESQGVEVSLAAQLGLLLPLQHRLRIAAAHNVLPLAAAAARARLARLDLDAEGRGRGGGGGEGGGLHPGRIYGEQKRATSPPALSAHRGAFG